MGNENKSSDLSTTESINIEKADKVSKSVRKDMQENTTDNEKDVSDAQSVLIIRIPLPFALGYITIDLGAFLSGLFNTLLAGVMAFLLAAIAKALASIFDSLLSGLIGLNGALNSDGFEISQSDIDGALSQLDLDSLVNQATLDYNNSLLGSSSINGGNFTTDSTSNDVNDEYTKPNNNKKRIANKSKYSIDKRNRKNILDSEEVNNRNSSNNKNIKTVRNPNYGVYLD